MPVKRTNQAPVTDIEKGQFYSVTLTRLFLRVALPSGVDGPDIDERMMTVEFSFAI